MSRINKYIASKTEYSRRKADKVIEDGKVMVNGEILKDFSYEVMPGDEVMVNGLIISDIKQKLKYYAFNKPKKVLSAVSDFNDRITIADYFPEGTRLFPVGRLDYDSRGLIIVTNDGDFSNKLMHPRYEVSKTYLVQIDRHLTTNQMREFSIGIDLDDGKTKACEIDYYDYALKIYRVKIWEGRNRQIRRMMSFFGKDVIDLKRISVGKIKLGNLKEGKYRSFGKNDMEYVKKTLGE